MNKVICFIFTISLFSCNNKGRENSPYSEILNKPPYESITDSIRKFPENDDLYFRRAVLLNRNNFPEPALADFRKAWEIAPSEKYAYGVTNALLEKNPDSAIPFLDRSLQNFPESYLLKLTRARALAALNRIDEALRASDSILAKNPEMAVVHLLQADLYEQKGDKKMSAVALQKSYQLAPDLEKAFRLAFAYAEIKHPLTIRFCDSLIKADTLKLHASPVFVKGIYYSNTNDKTRAINAFDETIKRDYNFLDAYIEKGRILVDQKKLPQALQTFELANTIKPSFPDAWYWMALCQELLGDTESAKLNYQKAYSLDKSFIEAKEAAEKL